MRRPLSYLLFLVLLLAGPCAWAQQYLNFSIQQPAPPVAAFGYGQSNLTFSFNDLSTGGAVAWHWDFGTGDTSNLQNPTYTYPGSGAAVVCLTVYDANNCSAMHCDSLSLVGLDGGSSLPMIHVRPNPFRDQTSVMYQLNAAGRVTVAVYDLRGRQLSHADLGEMPSGSYQYELGSGLAAGSYLVTLQIDGQSVSRHIVKQ